MEGRREGANRVDESYTELRPLLFSIAYRMLGSASEAEDIVQEAFLRFHRETRDAAPRSTIRRPTCPR